MPEVSFISYSRSAYIPLSIDHSSTSKYKTSQSLSTTFNLASQKADSKAMDPDKREFYEDLAIIKEKNRIMQKATFKPERKGDENENSSDKALEKGVDRRDHAEDKSKGTGGLSKDTGGSEGSSSKTK